MGTSGTESCEGCLQTQFKHLPPQLALKLTGPLNEELFETSYNELEICQD